eukprot:105690_1
MSSVLPKISKTFQKMNIITVKSPHRNLPGYFCKQYRTYYSNRIICISSAGYSAKSYIPPVADIDEFVKPMVTPKQKELFQEKMVQYCGNSQWNPFQTTLRQILDPFIDTANNTYIYNDEMKDLLKEYTGIAEWAVCYDENNKIYTSDMLIFYICWCMDSFDCYSTS